MLVGPSVVRLGSRKKPRSTPSRRVLRRVPCVRGCVQTRTHMRASCIFRGRITRARVSAFAFFAAQTVASVCVTRMLLSALTHRTHGKSKPRATHFISTGSVDGFILTDYKPAWVYHSFYTNYLKIFALQHLYCLLSIILFTLTY